MKVRPTDPETIMKSYSTEAIRPAMPRFHLRQSNGLYWPITFVFVTERMGREIMQERSGFFGRSVFFTRWEDPKKKSCSDYNAQVFQ